MNIRPRGRAGFTLVELLISGGLMTTILVSAYLCLSAGVSSEKLIEARSDSARSARAALAVMAADLRNAVPLSKEFEFLGMRRTIDDSDADNLDFATRDNAPRSAREGGQCEVSYFLSKDPEFRSFILRRRRDATPDPEPLQGGTTEELARGVLGLRFEYYDGWDWYDEWGDPTGKKQSSLSPAPNLLGLPEAVRIILTFDPAYEGNRRADAKEQSSEPPLVFETTARLNMALFFHRTSSGSRTNSNAQASEPAPQELNPGGPR